jgi:hypothetical protein
MLYQYNMGADYGWNINLCDYEEIVSKMPTNLNRSYTKTPKLIKQFYQSLDK